MSGGERHMVAFARAFVVPSKADPARRAVLRSRRGGRQRSDGGARQAAGEVSDDRGEHHAGTVMSVMDRAYVLVNGAVAFEGEQAS